MSKSAWICFECRESVRRGTQHVGQVPCPKCREPMCRLGYKIPVPPKRSLKAWTALREQLMRERHEQADGAAAASVRQRHATEQEIERLNAKPPNPGRQKAVRLLRQQVNEG